MSLSMKEFFDSLSTSWDEKEQSSLDERRNFLSFLDIKEGEKVLDLACGTGVITPLLLEKSKCQVTAIDLSPKMIEIAKKKYHDSPLMKFISADFYNFNEGKYDWIIVFNAYPHFLNREAFKEKVLELLNENGKLAIIHNLSRKTLIKTHEGKAHPYSRDLESPRDEARFYQDKMNVILSKEDDTSYKLILEKK